MAIQVPTDETNVYVPRLEQGDHLTRDEFERRYHAMPNLKKAELVEGVVHMPSPVRLTQHAKPHSWMAAWAATYEAETKGVESADNATVRLDWENEPQPDVLIRILPEHGGNSTCEDDYVTGPPELILETTASTASYDLHEKKRAYRRNSVREYLVWLVEEERLEWWELVSGEYTSLPKDDAGVIRSQVFPGLWLDCDALLAGNLSQVLQCVREGTTSEEHQVFVESLAQAAE